LTPDTRSTADSARVPVLLAGGTVVTMDQARRVEQVDVLVGSDGAITALLPPGSPPPSGTRVVDSAGCLVVPGLIQAHLHLCQTLFRGLSEERPLLAWLRERIWPLEAAHDEASLRASARLGIAELLLSGTTALLDMGTVYHTEQLFLVAEESGIRYTGGQALMDRGEGVPVGLCQPTDEALAESDALFARWDGAAGGRLRYAYTPRFILTCTPELMEAVVERARRGARVHTHASEQ
jgi:5-methylthioadenosine/S-adenosylhomocysteine deaminase